MKHNDKLQCNTNKRRAGYKCTHRIFVDINSAPINVQENNEQHTGHQKVSKKVLMLDSKLYLKVCFSCDTSQPPRRLINRTLGHTFQKYQQTDSDSFNTQRSPSFPIHPKNETTFLQD